jgi:hypothetical protein
VDVYPDRIEDRGGTTLGLSNIGALCAGAAAGEWPKLIDDHVRLVATPARELADMTDTEFEQGLYLRLVGAGYVADPARWATRASSRRDCSRCCRSTSGRLWPRPHGRS